LCGNGTRGDQVDNARFFEANQAALILVGKDADSENMKEKLTKLLDENVRKHFSDQMKKLCGSEIPAKKIAQIIFEETKK